MLGKKTGPYSFEYTVIALSLIISSVALALIMVTERGGEEKNAGDEGASGEEVDWVEGWLEYSGEWQMPGVSLPPPPVRETEVDLQASQRAGGMAPRISTPPPGDGGAGWDLEALDVVEGHISEQVAKRGEMLYHVDLTGTLRIYNLSERTLILQRDMQGRPVSFINVSGLGILLLTDPPRGDLPEILLRGRGPEEGGTLILLDLDRNGRTIYGIRLPGHPLSLHLQGSYLYVFTATMELEGNELALNCSLVGCDLSVPGRINLTLLRSGLGPSLRWLEGHALIQEGDHMLLAELHPPGLEVLSALTLPESRWPLAIDLRGGYLRVAEPWKDRLLFYRIAESSGHGGLFTPVEVTFRVPDISFSKEHAFLFGRYVFVTSYTVAGITPRVFDASSPSNFSYLGEVPVEGGEVLFNMGEYLLVARLGCAPSLTILRWQRPINFEVLSRTSVTTYPPVVQITETRGVIVEGGEAVFVVRGVTPSGKSQLVLSSIHIDLTSGELRTGRVYPISERIYPADFWIIPGGRAHLVLLGRLSTGTWSALSVADLSQDGPLVLLWPEFVPLEVGEHFAGIFVAGLYQETGSVVLRYYPAEWDGTAPPEEEIPLLEGITACYIKVHLIRGVGYLDVVIAAWETAPVDEGWLTNISFFRVAPCCSGFSRAISAPGALMLTGVHPLLDITGAGERSYLLFCNDYGDKLVLYSLDINGGKGFSWICNITTSRPVYSRPVTFACGDSLYIFFPHSGAQPDTYCVAVNFTTLQKWEGNISAIPLGGVGEILVVIGWDTVGYYLEGWRVMDGKGFNITWSYLLPDYPYTAALSGNELALVLGGAIFSQFLSYGIEDIIFEGRDLNQTCLLLNVSDEGAEVLHALHTTGVDRVLMTGSGPLLRYPLHIYTPSDGTFYYGFEWYLKEALKIPRGLLLHTSFWIFLSQPGGAREVLL